MLGKYKESKFHFSPAQIMVFGFAITILLGAMLLNTSMASNTGEKVGFLNALFTSTSSVCVTGLVVVDTGTYWSAFGKTVIIFLIQIGGLGFMSMTTMFAILVRKKINLKQRLLIQESLNQNELSGLVRLTKHILIGTFIIEGAGALILSTVFIPEFGIKKGIAYSVFHSISAFCNAGFDLMGNFSSLTSYRDNIIVNFVIMALIILGGLGFTVILEFIKKKRFSLLSLHSKIVISITTSLIVLGFVCFFAIEYNNAATMKDMPLKGKIMASLFQSVSPRTAGFNTIDLTAMRDSSKFLTIILMFIGGSPASTAGGIKTATFGVLVFMVISLIKGKEDIESFKKRIPLSVVKKSIAILGLGLCVVVTTTMVLSLSEAGMDFLDILFESVSAFATVGLTLGITTSLSSIGKICIIICMFTGRVGVLTILYALANKKRKTIIRYPEDKIIVG